MEFIFIKYLKNLPKYFASHCNNLNFGCGVKTKSHQNDSLIARFATFGHTFTMKIVSNSPKKFEKYLRFTLSEQRRNIWCCPIKQKPLSLNKVSKVIFLRFRGDIWFIKLVLDFKFWHWNCHFLHPQNHLNQNMLQCDMPFTEIICKKHINGVGGASICFFYVVDTHTKCIINDFAPAPRTNILIFQCHTVTHGTNLRKSPHGGYSKLQHRIPSIL